MFTYYIIEHSTRGCFVDWVEDFGKGGDKPKFAWAVPRTHEKIKRYYRRDKAVDDVNRLANTRLGKSKVTGAYVLAITVRDGKLVCITDLLGHRK